MTPDAVGVAHRSTIIHEDGERNTKTLPVLFNRLRFLFYRDFQDDQISISDLIGKFSEGRRLLPAGRSPCCEKVQDNDLPS
jgi:hypothetical protein